MHLGFLNELNKENAVHGENNNNKAHKEYVKHMFPDGHPEILLVAPAALKKDL